MPYLVGAQCGSQCYSGSRSRQSLIQHHYRQRHYHRRELEGFDSRRSARADVNAACPTHSELVSSSLVDLIVQLECFRHSYGRVVGPGPAWLSVYPR